MMAGRSGSKAVFVVTNDFTSSSDEDKDKKEIEDLELPDFEPFMAMYRRYSKEQSDQEIQQLMHTGLCSIRENPFIVKIVRKMFDFDLEVGYIEKNILFVKEKLELTFNFMDISSNK